LASFLIQICSNTCISSKAKAGSSAVVPARSALPPVLDDVAAVAGGGVGATVCAGAGSGGSAPHYRLPLRSAGSSDVTAPDWSV
jgi:hypothetical protein